MERVSAESNALWQLDMKMGDEVHLLHSDTGKGQEAAAGLRAYLTEVWGQQQVRLHRLPGLHYEVEDEAPPLLQMARLIDQLIGSAPGRVTLVAAGGMKPQAMMMAMVGHCRGVPVCHVVNQRLLYVPVLAGSEWGSAVVTPRKVDLPVSGRPREQVIQVSGKEHHRPRRWARAEKLLRDLSWVDHVRFDEQAYNAPRDGVKAAPRGTEDGRHVLWLHLYDSDERRMAVSIETTGYKPEHKEQAAAELRERLFV